MPYAYKGSTVVADHGQTQLMEKDNKHFAKFFLISDEKNLKNWQVTPESIVQRIRTFIDRPFISEPGLAHFGADYMPVDKILENQEKYRAGNIVDVQYNQSTGVATAIVEITDDKVWQELKDGKAIYVSPAVAGMSQQVGNVKLFFDWFGLHLARVDKPAYGVMHASIKQTCEGNERSCIQRLIASASLNAPENTSFNILGLSHCEMSALEQKVANLEKSFASFKDELPNILKTAIASAIPITQEGIGGKASTEITDAVPDNEKQNPRTDEYSSGPDTAASGQGSTGSKTVPTPQKQGDKTFGEGDINGASASLKSEVKRLQTVLANYEAKEKSKLVDEILEMQATAGIIDQATEQAARTKLMSYSMTTLEGKKADMEPMIQRILNLTNGSQGLSEHTGARIVSQVASASADEDMPTCLEDLRKEHLVA